MDSEKIYQLITPIIFFEKFSEEEKQVVSKLNIPVFLFHPEEPIIRQGDKDTSLYILLKGTVSVVRDEVVGISKLEPGSIFGEMSLLGNQPRTTSIIADEEVIALKIGQQDLNTMPLGLVNKFKDQFITILINRLDEMNKTMAKMLRY